MTRLSTGQDSTLGVWQELCNRHFHPGHPCHAYLRQKIEDSVDGVDEGVLVPETQFLYMLANLGETI